MTTQELISATALNYIANEAACQIDNPLHAERLRDLIPEALRQAASRLSEMEAENKRLRELLADALGMASQHRVAALDAEHGARGDRTRPASDAEWYAFQGRIRAALEQQQKGEEL